MRLFRLVDECSWVVETIRCDAARWWAGGGRQTKRCGLMRSQEAARSRGVDPCCVLYNTTWRRFHRRAA